MAPKKASPGNRGLGPIALVASTYVLLAPMVAEAAAPIAVFGLGPKLILGVPTQLHRFHENGTLEQRWELPESDYASSLTTVGSVLYVAEFRGAIHRYHLNGDVIDEFADVSRMAGPIPIGQSLESDAAGNVYTAFAGFSSNPRQSFRLAPDGTISGTFSHPDLVFPRGIDATTSGEVYIVNSAAVGVGDRLFKFDATGAYMNDFPIPDTENPADIAIDERRQLLYVADEFGESVDVYDISTGAPVFSHALLTPGRAVDVFVEPTSGRIFGTLAAQEADSMGPFSIYYGFEVSENGIVQNLYKTAMPREYTFRRIAAVVVPEPSVVPLALAGPWAHYFFARRRRT